MPLAKRAMIRWKNFNMPVSYRLNQPDKMRDARNVFTNQNLLETRPGVTRWNSTAFSDIPLSLSFFTSNAGTNYLLAKDGTVLYRANASGAHTSIKTGLSAATKHRAVTFGNRHILAIEGDGLFQFNGTTVTQLGQVAPGAPTVAVSGSGKTLPSSTYKVGVTFYDSTNGFETNLGESAEIAVTLGQQIDVTAIPTSAANANIDKKRIYLKDVTADGPWIFWDEINLAVTTETIDDEPTSTIEAPETHAPPVAGGAKYLAVFGNKLAYAGSASFPSEVFISEEYIPDAFDDTATRTVIKASGQGPITGLAVGFFNDSHLEPYLVTFKRNHIEIYSEVGGEARRAVISDEVGCISHDTIQIVNGVIYFMSNKGWRAIFNGSILSNDNRPRSLANGDIDDIFTRDGFVYELNRSQFSNFFSVYYPTFDHYMTFVSEGSNTSISKCYAYEFQIDGFRPFEWELSFKAAVLGLDSDNDDVIFLAGTGGYIYTYSVKQELHDVDMNNNEIGINAFFQLYWINGDDMDASFNFGPLILRSLAQDTATTIKYFMDYSLQTPTDLSFDFSNPETGFILDVSKLDEGILGDGRTWVRYVGEILKSGQSLLIGFYKNVADENIALIEGQLDLSKNGNPN